MNSLKLIFAITLIQQGKSAKACTGANGAYMTCNKDKCDGTTTTKCTAG